MEGQTGSVQLSLSAPVAQYAAMYAVCQEKDKYGNLQNYICDLDNNVQLDVAAISNYADSPDEDTDVYKRQAVGSGRPARAERPPCGGLSGRT